MIRIEISIGGRQQVVTVEGAGNDTLIASVETADDALIASGGTTDRVRLEPLAGEECWRLVADGRAVPVRVRSHGGELLVTAGSLRLPVRVRRALPVPSRRGAESNSIHRIEVRAPMPGLVNAVPLGAGQQVGPGCVAAVVEAMKMQMEVFVPASGIVEEVRVRAGQEVAGGQVLMVLRAQEGDGGPA